MREKDRTGPASRLRTAVPPARHAPFFYTSAASEWLRRCPKTGRRSGRCGLWRVRMKQASSRELFGYWTQRRGTRAAPERGEIEPSAIRRALGDVFILEFARQGGHPFRLAGTRVCALFWRELTNEQFPNFLDAPSRLGVADLLDV